MVLVVVVGAAVVVVVEVVVVVVVLVVVVLVVVVLVGAGPPNSNEPESHGDALRAVPRWSVEGHESVALSIAGLPISRAIVLVGPPLFASVPRSASVLLRLLDWVKLHDASLLRLPPESVIDPLQF